MRIVRLIATVAFGLVLFAPLSSAQERREFEAFYYFADAPEVLYYTKPLIEEGEANLFWFALQDWAPDAETLVINNAGGDGDEAIVIADMIRSWQLDTYIPEGSVCYSSCVLLFFAGVGRLAEGNLGVHQGVLGDGTVGTTQRVVARFDAELLRLSGSPVVVERGNTTPPDQIYIFSPDELSSLGINRSREEGLARLEAEAFVEGPRTPWQPVNEQPVPVGSLVSFFVTRVDRAGRDLDPIPAYARWAIIPAQSPWAMISIELPSLDQRLSIYLRKIFYPDVPFVDYEIIITGNHADTFSDDIRVGFQRPGELAHYLKYLNYTPVRADNYFNVFFPRTLSDFNFDDLAEAQFIVFFLEFLDGSILMYPLELGDGDTALNRAIAAWRP